MRYEEKLSNIIRKLYIKTINGEIRWEQHPTSGLVYRVTVGNSTLDIGYVEAPDSIDLEISIHDPAGKLVESVRDTSLNTIPVGVPGYSGWFSLMSEIYDTARRQSTGSEELIDKLLLDLDDNSPF